MELQEETGKFTISTTILRIKIAQLVENLPAMQETLVLSLGLEEPLGKGQATHSGILELPLWLSY